MPQYEDFAVEKVTDDELKRRLNEGLKNVPLPVFAPKRRQPNTKTPAGVCKNGGVSLLSGARRRRSLPGQVDLFA